MEQTWKPTVLGDDLAGKRVLITGSSRGIGAAVARAMAGLGARVVVHAHASRAAADAVVAEIVAGGGSASLVMGDCRIEGEVRALVGSAVDRLGGLDILINNAGTMVRRAVIEDMDDGLIDDILHLNVHSVIHATRFALPALRAAGRGAIINTSSIAARQGGGPGSGIYASAKAFVSNFTRGNAKELAADGIRVNAVSPGTIATDFHRRYSTPERLDAIAATTPMKRNGTAEDCVGAYLFLASERMSGYVTGQVIEVNGGQFVG